ncbi:MAG: DUF6174 domain-containing protein [Gammaproteobacteria bacterium]|nr:DUF6174 domain-containing protein [Gammaproteobacteria bacterium]
MRALLFAIGLCLLSSSCSIFDCSENDKERVGIDQLAERKTQWQGNQLSNYVLTYKQSCFCAAEINEVTITNGEVTAVVIKNSDGEPVRNVPADEFQNYYTVEKFFDFILEKNKSVDVLKVEYDSALGYPSYFFVDPHSHHCDCMGQCSDTIDDEYSYTISVTVNS